MADISVKAAYANGNLTVTVDGLTGIGEICVNDSDSPLTFVHPPKGEATRAVALDGNDGTVTVFDTITTKTATCEIEFKDVEHSEPEQDTVTVTLSREKVEALASNMETLAAALRSCIE